MISGLLEALGCVGRRSPFGEAEQPDYVQDPSWWFVCPPLGKEGPEGFVPQFERTAPGPGGQASISAKVAVHSEAPADLFFVHGTLSTVRGYFTGNQDSRDAMSDFNWSKCYVSGQISAFSHVARCFAPFYRQRTFSMMASKESMVTAYADVAAAFDAYLSQWGGDRPLFIVGHSQGAYHVMRLLRDRFSGEGVAAAALRRRLVGAYAPGCSVVNRRLPAGIPLCRRPGHAGSLAIWMTVGHDGPLSETFIGKQMRSGRAAKLPVELNPLSWETVEDGGEGREVSGTEHMGSLGPQGKVLHRHVIDSAVVRGGLLRVQLRHPEFIRALQRSKLDCHTVDIALFWANVRQQAEQQLEAWQRGEGLERSSAPSAPTPAACAEGGAQQGVEDSEDDYPAVADHEELSEIMSRLGTSDTEKEG